MHEIRLVIDCFFLLLRIQVFCFLRKLVYLALKIDIILIKGFLTFKSSRFTFLFLHLLFHLFLCLLFMRFLHGFWLCLGFYLSIWGWHLSGYTVSGLLISYTRNSFSIDGHHFVGCWSLNYSYRLCFLSFFFIIIVFIIVVIIIIVTFLILALSFFLK